MIWIGMVFFYLLIGFYFTKPKEWNRFQKIAGHLFWLPVIVYIIWKLKKEGI